MGARSAPTLGQIDAWRMAGPGAVDACEAAPLNPAEAATSPFVAKRRSVRIFRAAVLRCNPHPLA